MTGSSITNKITINNLIYLNPNRSKIYNRGGVVFASSTVLALDLLRKNVRTHCISGFLVDRAHR